MRRSFLRELNLDAEVIDKIMAENGKDIEKYKTQIEDYVTEIKDLKAKAVDVDKAIEEAVKKKENEFATQLQDKDKAIEEANNKVKGFDEITKELNNLKKANSDREYSQAIDNFFKEGKLEFTSNLAKEAILNKFKEQKFELQEGKFGKDAEKFMKELKEANADAFKNGESKDNEQPYQYKPQGGGADPSADMQAQVNSILGLNNN